MENISRSKITARSVIIRSIIPRRSCFFDERADFLRMGIAAYRISFTIEEEEQAAFILDLLSGRSFPENTA